MSFRPSRGAEAVRNEGIFGGLTFPPSKEVGFPYRRDFREGNGEGRKRDGRGDPKRGGRGGLKRGKTDTSWGRRPIAD